MSIYSGFILSVQCSRITKCTASSSCDMHACLSFTRAAGVDFIPENQGITFPASRTGSRVCTSIGIIDDIFPENFVEQFNVEVILPSFVGLSPGENEEVCVTITDDDQCKAIIEMSTAA